MKACDPMTATVEELQKAFPDLGLFSAEDIVAWRMDHNAFPPETTLVGDFGLDRDLAKRLAEFATAWVKAAEVLKEPAAAADSSTGPTSVEGTKLLAEAKAAGYLFDDDDTSGKPPGPSVSFTDHPASGPGTSTLIGVAPPPPASTPSRSPKPEARASEVIDVTNTAQSIRADDFDRAAAALDEIFHDRGRSLPAAAAPPPPAPPSAPPQTEPSSEAPTHPTPPPPVKLIANDFAEEPPRAEAVSQPLIEEEPFEEKPVFIEEPEPPKAEGDRPTIASEKEAEAEAATATEATTTTTSTTKKAGARKLVPALLAVVLAANIGLGVGLFQTRREEQKALAPIAPMSAEVKAIHSGQVTLEKELDKTKAALAETKAQVDKHEKAIVTTTHAVEKVAEDQKAAEEANLRETAAINQRLTSFERNRRETTYSLAEVVKIIDAVQDPRPTTNNTSTSTPSTHESGAHPPAAHPPSAAPATHAAAPTAAHAPAPPAATHAPAAHDDHAHH